MELKEFKTQLETLQLTEELRTTEYITRIFAKHLTTLDLSNHFLLTRSTATLLKLFTYHFSKNYSITSMILQNCSIPQKNLIKLLNCLESSQKPLRFLDISNNRLLIDLPIINHLLSTINKKKLISLILKGNLCIDPDPIASLLSSGIKLLELNLYDTSLSPDVLLTISQALASNLTILSLNLGFNSDAFQDPTIVKIFGSSITENSFIERLDLSGNVGLGDQENLLALCEGIKGNRTLSYLILAAVSLNDCGVKILVDNMLSEFPVLILDLQNNNIKDRGLKHLMKKLPDSINSLDLSYNTFTQDSSIDVISEFLLRTKSLRKLNLSHAFELETFAKGSLDFFCSAIIRNDSLTEMFCENLRSPQNSDALCLKIHSAIRFRKLTLNYKISAVSSGFKMSFDNSINSDMSSRIKGIKNHESCVKTVKKNYNESIDPKAGTSKNIDISNLFH